MMQMARARGPVHVPSRCLHNLHTELERGSTS